MMIISYIILNVKWNCYKIFKRCNGEKLNLPKRLYRQEFIADLANQTLDRRERAKIARAGGYSASTIEDLLGKRSKKKYSQSV